MQICSSKYSYKKTHIFYNVKIFYTRIWVCQDSRNVSQNCLWRKLLASHCIHTLRTSINEDLIAAHTSFCRFRRKLLLSSDTPLTFTLAIQNSHQSDDKTCFRTGILLILSYCHLHTHSHLKKLIVYIFLHPKAYLHKRKLYLWNNELQIYDLCYQLNKANFKAAYFL